MIPMKPLKKYLLTHYYAALIPVLLWLERPVLLQGKKDGKPAPVVASSAGEATIVGEDGRIVHSLHRLAEAGVFLHVNPDDLLAASAEYVRRLRATGAEYLQHKNREHRYTQGDLVTLRPESPYRFPALGSPATVVEDRPDLASRTPNPAGMYERAEVLIGVDTGEGFRPYLVDPFWLVPWTGASSKPIEEKIDAHAAAFAEIDKTLSGTTH